MGKKRQKKQQSLRMNRVLVAAALVAGVAAGSASAHLSASLLAIQPFDSAATEVPSLSAGTPAAPMPEFLTSPPVDLRWVPASGDAGYPGLPQVAAPPAFSGNPFQAPAPAFPAAPEPAIPPAPEPANGGFLCKVFGVSCGEPAVVEEPVVFDSASSSSTGGGGFLCKVFAISCDTAEEVIGPTRDSIFTSSDAGIPSQQQGIDGQGRFPSPSGSPPAEEGSVSSPDALPGGIPTSVEQASPPAPFGLPQVAPPPAPSGLPSGHPSAQTSPPSHPVWMPAEQILTISPEFAPDLPWLRQSSTCGTTGVSWAIQECKTSVLVNPSPAGGPGLKIMTTVPDSLRDQQTQFLDLIRERTGQEIEVVPGIPPTVNPPEPIVPPGEEFILHGAGGEPTCEDSVDNDTDQLIDRADPDCAVNAALGAPSEFRSQLWNMANNARVQLPLSCKDGSDNNLNQLADADDALCMNLQAEPSMPGT